MVASLCVRFIVLSSVKFYRQFHFTAVEIEYIPLNWMLPPKAKTVKLLASQAMP